MSSRASKPAASLVFPQPRTYIGKGGSPAKITDLPFVSKIGHEWVVPPCDSYAEAIVVGEAYGAHLAQFIASNQRRGAEGNALLRIAGAIDFNANSPLHGYRIGFFSYLQELMYAEAIRRNLVVDITEIGKKFVRVGEFSRACAKTGGNHAEGRPHVYL